MAQSIGDLFITLGFNVDLQKLNDFSDSVQSVFGSILKLSAIAGTGAGLYEIAAGVAQTTNKWRDFNHCLKVGSLAQPNYKSLLRFILR